MCEENNAEFSFMKPDIALTCGSEGRQLVGLGGQRRFPGEAVRAGLGRRPRAGKTDVLGGMYV